MKKFERIFLYTILAILVFYVFLIDNNAESQVAIQEEIRARSILIVNDAGQEVIKLLTNDENNGLVVIYNKSGNPVAFMGASRLEGGVMCVTNEDGTPVVNMVADENNNGGVSISDKDGNTVVGMTVVYKWGRANGAIGVINKDGTLLADIAP